MKIFDPRSTFAIPGMGDFLGSFGFNPDGNILSINGTLGSQVLELEGVIVLANGQTSQSVADAIVGGTLVYQPNDQEGVDLVLDGVVIARRMKQGGQGGGNYQPQLVATINLAPGCQWIGQGNPDGSTTITINK